MVRLTLFSFQRSTLLPCSNFYIISNLRFDVNTFLKKFQSFFLLDVIECFATTSLVYQVVCYLSTTFFLIFQVFLKLEMLFYFCHSACFISALRQDIIYQVSERWSTKICIFFELFFVTDCFITFVVHCSFLTRKTVMILGIF